MKILKTGKKPEEKEAIVDCRNCKCQFSFQAKEGTFRSDQRDGDSYTIGCPECAYVIWVSISEFK